MSDPHTDTADVPAVSEASDVTAPPEPASLHEDVRLLKEGGQRSMTIHPSLSGRVTLELGHPHSRCVLTSAERFAEIRDPDVRYVIYQPEVYRRSGGEAGYATLPGPEEERAITIGRRLASRGFAFSTHHTSREHCNVSLDPDGYILIENRSPRGTIVRAREADVVEPPNAIAAAAGSP